MAKVWINGKPVEREVWRKDGVVEVQLTEEDTSGEVLTVELERDEEAQG